MADPEKSLSRRVPMASCIASGMGLGFTYSSGIREILSGKSDPYDYLINSIDKFYNQDQLSDEIKNQNFRNVTYRNLSAGIVAIHSAWKI